MSFYGSELVPKLWQHGYRMKDIQSFLGADAIFPEPEWASVVLAAWIDAVHCTAMAYTRGRGHRPTVEHLAARLKTFAVKFAKGAHSTGWLANALCPSNASMQQWT